MAPDTLAPDETGMSSEPDDVQHSSLECDSLGRIESLPLEILGAIFSYLCHHCRQESFSKTGESVQRSDIEALKALSQTNKRFRSVALPIILHSPSPLISCSYIIHVLNQQPGLTQCVKALNLPLSGTSNRELRLLLGNVAQELAIDLSSTNVSWDRQEDVETDLLIALCPNVEQLKIPVTDSEGDGPKSTFSVLRRHFSNLGDDPAFPKLRYLEIDTSKCRSFSITGAELPLFLHECPALETLVLQGPKWQRIPDLDRRFNLQSCRPALENLTTVELKEWSFFGGDPDTFTLGDMIQMTPNLKSFTITTAEGRKWGTSEVERYHMPPTRFIEILKPLHGTLQQLRLEFKQKVSARDYQYPSLMILSPQQLGAFPNLRVLELDIPCYCRHIFDSSKVGSSYDQRTCLAGLLPVTITHLTIILKQGGYDEPLYDIFHLGKRAVAGDFPRLQRVQVDAPVRYLMPCSDSWDDYWDNEQLDKISRTQSRHERELQEAFEGSGVRTVLRRWYIWEEMY
ncbi:hypothetical protein NM208_g11973 [Fusarium decemcellulare]|uniref:Uncharacterized protein n=1 Tax=Fusarium decemcellulare TaxID=57161 RepID=A0ACC1RTT3_9HYPO|nr:hypothetical protein NM208_g11973 [Fusarium decemcellulare]